MDLGSRRIGVAHSDSGGTLASPHGVLPRGSGHPADHAALADMVAETGAEVVVVGLPLSLDGQLGPAAMGVLAEVEELAAVLSVTVETQDERFTTVTAARAMRRAGRSSRAQRPVVDGAAAAVLLQAWLDRRRAGGASSRPATDTMGRPS